MVSIVYRRRVRILSPARLPIPPLSRSLFAVSVYAFSSVTEYRHAMGILSLILALERRALPINQEKRGGWEV
jgi:hypothetical protein